MALRVPPPEIPVVKFLGPNKADQGLIEFWNTELANYTPLDVGAPHPNTRQYANYRLGNQRPLEGDEKWVIRTWITPETSPDWFNYALKFSGEGNAYPVFIRTYREFKSTYEPRPKGSALGALYRLVLSNVGSGYAAGSLPEVRFDEPAVPPTQVAIAHGVVSSDGSVQECVIDFGGEGYLDQVAFTVESPLGGIPAEGIAYIQPVTAILTQEEAKSYPEESEFYAQYLQVIRVYETLPGPPLVSTEFERDGIKKVVTKQRFQVGSELTDEAVNAGVLTRHFYNTIDTVVSEQVEEVITVDDNDLLDEPAFTTSIINVIPEIFRALIPQHIESHIVPGDPVEIPLVLGEFEHTERALHPLYKEVRSTILDNIGNLPITISGIRETNADKQVVSISMTLELDSTPPSLPDATTDVDYKKLGNGMAVEIITSIPEVFGNEVAETSITDPIPVEFRALFPTYTRAITIEGTVTFPPVLVTGELSRREEQLTEFTMRRTTSGHAATGLPVTHISHELTAEFGGTILQVTATLNDVDMSVDEGRMVLTSECKNLGNGLFLLITREADTDTQWPTIESTLWDEDKEVEYTEFRQVVQAGSATTVNPGVWGWLSEVKSIDKWRSLRINTHVPVPPHVGEGSAKIEYEFKPYTFPGLFQQFTTLQAYYQSARSSLVQHTIRTWWETSPTTPAIAFDEFIPGGVTFQGNQYNNVFHDFVVDTATGINYFPTSPSYTQYRGQQYVYTLSGAVTFTHNNTTVTGVGTSFLSQVSIGDIIAGYTVDSITNDTAFEFTNPYPGETATYTDSAVGYGFSGGFINTERVIAATVTKDKLLEIWKIVTESVIMR